MRVLVKKMNKMGLLRFVLIYYGVIMTALALALPVTVAVLDVTLLTNPTVLCMSLGAMLFFGGIGYLTFIRPYIIYHKLPEVLAETDGQFLYIHAIKEGEIPLSSLADASLDVHVPRLFQPGFLREFIIHIFSSHYGDIILEVPNYGKFKLRFVADAETVANELANVLFK
jgi:hypothetical protein